MGLVMQGSSSSKQALTALIKERVLYCIHHHRSLDVASSMQQELALLTHLVTDTPTADAQAWQSQMLLLFQLLLPATGEVTSCDQSRRIMVYLPKHLMACRRMLLLPLPHCCILWLVHLLGVTRISFVHNLMQQDWPYASTNSHNRQQCTSNVPDLVRPFLASFHSVYSAHK